MMETEVTGKVDVTWDVAKDGRVVNSEPWFNSTGILNYRIADFDYDGSLELFVVSIVDAPRLD